MFLKVKFKAMLLAHCNTFRNQNFISLMKKKCKRETTKTPKILPRDVTGNYCLHSRSDSAAIQEKNAKYSTESFILGFNEAAVAAGILIFVAKCKVKIRMVYPMVLCLSSCPNQALFLVTNQTVIYVKSLSLWTINPFRGNISILQ